MEKMCPVFFLRGAKIIRSALLSSAVGATVDNHRTAIVTATTPRFRRGRRGGQPPRPLPLPGLPTGMTTPITNAYGNSRVYLQFCETCAARRHIGPRNGSPGGTFSRVMRRPAAHLGRFSTNEPAIEPTKTQESDERTHGIEKRTRASANEPEVRVAAPAPSCPLGINGMAPGLPLHSQPGSSSGPKNEPETP